MVTVSVVAILVALAIPDFQRFIQKNRIDSEILDLQSFLMAARGQAIKTGQDTWITSTTNDWNGQLRYFGDVNGDRVQDATEPTAGQFRAPTQIALIPTAAVATGIGYNSRGEIIGVANTANGSVAIQVPTLIDKPNFFVGVMRFATSGRSTVIRYKNPVASSASGVADGGWN